MQTPAELDVIGIGNALVDVISHESDEFVAAQQLAKGTMHLIDEARAQELYDAMGPGVEMSGGSAANTIVGIASFGGRAQYIGKVRHDQLGEVFTHDLRSIGVGFDTPLAMVRAVLDALRPKVAVDAAALFLSPRDGRPPGSSIVRCGGPEGKEADTAWLDSEEALGRLAVEIDRPQAVGPDEIPRAGVETPITEKSMVL